MIMLLKLRLRYRVKLQAFFEFFNGKRLVQVICKIGALPCAEHIASAGNDGKVHSINFTQFYSSIEA